MRNLQYYIIVIPAALIAISFHEMSHALAARLLGDRTAESRGRLNFNPLSHIDPLGLLCMVFFGFGWARPVPVNPRYFKNPKTGMAVTAFAGPLSNFVLGFVSLFLYIALTVSFSGRVVSAFAQFMYVLATMNVGLGIFNLIPIPPLDGSKILFMFLPNRWAAWCYQYEGYIRFGLVFCLYLGLLDGVIVAGQSFVLGRFLTWGLKICSAVGLL